MLKIGVLLPRSTLYPVVGADFLNGLKACLSHQQISENCTVLIENIGFGTDDGDIYNKAEKMLLQEDADVVAIFAEPRIGEMLEPLFNSTNKILMVVNFGANLPENWKSGTNTIHLSHNFCLLAAQTGRLAAEESNKQIINVASFYDGGYHKSSCMISGNGDHGGITRFFYVTKLKTAEFTLQPVADFLENNKDVNTLLCLFSGEYAEKFYEEIGALQQKHNLSIYGSPMMLEDPMMTSIKNEDGFVNIRGFVPWHASLQNEANVQFKKQVADMAGKQANYFSLLGWDAGLIVKEILSDYTKGSKIAAETVARLGGIKIDSPRGWLNIDGETNHSFGPAYLVSTKNSNQISIEKELENIDEEWKLFTNSHSIPENGSSWKNTYLCV